MTTFSGLNIEIAKSLNKFLGQMMQKRKFFIGISRRHLMLFPQKMVQVRDLIFSISSG